jgi:homoserine kinase
MRAALPKTVPFDDAATNLARVALGVAGIAGRRTDLLRYLTIDRLHEPYRAKVYPQLPQLVAAAREAGALGACLSGSGSAVIAFTNTVAAVARIEAAFSAVAADTDLPGEATVVTPRNAGARVVHRS